MAYAPNYQKPYLMEDDITESSAVVWASDAFEALTTAYDMPPMTLKGLGSAIGANFGYEKDSVSVNTGNIAAKDLKVSNIDGATRNTDNLDIYFDGRRDADIRVSLMPMFWSIRKTTEHGKTLPEPKIVDQGNSDEGKLPSKDDIVGILDGSPPGIYDLKVLSPSYADIKPDTEIFARWEWDGKQIVF